MPNFLSLPESFLWLLVLPTESQKCRGFNIAQQQFSSNNWGDCFAVFSRGSPWELNSSYPSGICTFLTFFLFLSHLPTFLSPFLGSPLVSLESLSVHFWRTRRQYNDIRRQEAWLQIPVYLAILGRLFNQTLPQFSTCKMRIMCTILWHRQEDLSHNMSYNCPYLSLFTSKCHLWEEGRRAD